MKTRPNTKGFKLNYFFLTLTRTRSGGCTWPDICDF